MRVLRAMSSFVAAMALAAGATAQTKWDLASAYPATNFHTENLGRFAADVDQATAGKVKITLHPNAALFKAPEIKRAVQGGQAQAGEVLISLNYENEDGRCSASTSSRSWPTSYPAASKKLWQGVRSHPLEKKLASQGLMLLFAVPWGPQGIYAKKPTWQHAGGHERPEVARLQCPATSRIAELVGAQPVTIQAAEVSQAFATGVVESMMSSGSTGWDAKLHEHVKYWYDTQAWLPKNAVIVNKAAFDALDAPTQAAVKKAAADAETRGWEMSKKANTESLDKLKGGGMQIVPPPAALRADMKKVGDTMLKEWLDKSGPEGKQLVDAFGK